MSDPHLGLVLQRILARLASSTKAKDPDHLDGGLADETVDSWISQIGGIGESPDR